MSDPTNRIFAPSVAPATATRFLLQCRYDYRQRVWNLPAAQLSRAEAVRVLTRLQDYAGSLSALSTTLTAPFSDFANPGKGELLTPTRSQTKPKRVRPLSLRTGTFRAQKTVQP
jgi:hypothetical protein